jgi:hypothetical protein
MNGLGKQNEIGVCEHNEKTQQQFEEEPDALEPLGTT